jgi:hypothetical protein
MLLVLLYLSLVSCNGTPRLAIILCHPSHLTPPGDRVGGENDTLVLSGVVTEPVYTNSRKIIITNGTVLQASVESTIGVSSHSPFLICVTC